MASELPVSNRPSVSRPLRVLWAEDNAVVADLIRKALEARGYDCRVVPSGTDALAQFKASSAPFDVIGTDFQMPGMDGLNLTRSLRQEGYAGPILVFASKLTDQVMGEFRRCGVKEIFSKPAGFGAVLMVLKSIAAGTPGSGS